MILRFLIVLALVMAAGYYHFDCPFFSMLLLALYSQITNGVYFFFCFVQADELVFEAIVQVPDRSVSTSLY